jgi:signal transduction histidine kinase
VTTSVDSHLARVRAVSGRLPVATDALIVVFIVALGLLHGPGSRFGESGWIWTIGLALPLLKRRRWPVAVFAVIALIAFAQWATGARAFGDAALLVALYTVAASRPLRITAAAAAVLEIGIVLAVATWASDAGLNAFIALSALATTAAVTGINVRHRRALLESLHERAAQLEHERDQQGHLSAAAERSRIAREMHDIVAHNLSVMIALADGASYAVHDEPERAAAAMSTASRTGRQALTEMRRLLGVLREGPDPGALAPQPGLGQIDELIEQVRAAGLPVSHVQAGTPTDAVPAGFELAAYRIVQEALTNTLKHAGTGAEAVVALAWEPNRLRVDVWDSGTASAASPIEGGGLRGMRERAAVYDGVVEVGPSEQGGWRVRTELLLDRAAAETPA